MTVNRSCVGHSLYYTGQGHGLTVSNSLIFCQVSTYKSGKQPLTQGFTQINLPIPGSSFSSFPISVFIQLSFSIYVYCEPHLEDLHLFISVCVSLFAWHGQHSSPAEASRAVAPFRQFIISTLIHPDCSKTSFLRCSNRIRLIISPPKPIIRAATLKFLSHSRRLAPSHHQNSKSALTF